MTFALQDPDIPAMAGSAVATTTEVHPVGLAALLALIVLLWLLPRQWLPLPMILLLSLVPAGQRLLVGGIDFSFIRMLSWMTYVRMFVRKDLRRLELNLLDRLFLVWCGVLIVQGTLLGGTLTVFINRLGFALDALTIYFFFRTVIQNYDNLILIGRMFAFTSIPVFLFFVFESQTSRNLFHFMGGVPEFTDIRDGRLRCQGAFAHPIIAGCFWAQILPLHILAGLVTHRWLTAITGLAFAIGIILLTASSTPVMAIVFGVLGFVMYFFRSGMRWYRWMILAWLLILHYILMDKPVYHLLARIDLVGGSTGYHRYNIIDKSIDHFSEWWRFGTMTTAHWGYGCQDITNQFLLEGVNGGLLRLAMFLAMVVTTFVGVSRSMRSPVLSATAKKAAWILGTAMFMHCLNFIAISYFEQATVIWYMTLAAISSLTLVPGCDVAPDPALSRSARA
ncbi:MAG TPA: hypothetical protein VK348_07885 [Planctomycetota bacterium]|nr:hypothetical protein [Planctomycetota bacterium]